ncbi:class I SAM-dependent methyltransferase [Lentzea indica]|uniref:class I SAM-dependent methyltransferase n=1 Tax=Lentzea indica TaxID=2604800 RepID=UPI001CB7378C|nr:class I SAM-dependent methyltransferase [Lentzea indica]
MTIEHTSRAYGQRADEYIDAVGTMEATSPVDRDLVGAWARKHSGGQILDVGCGPGQWTNWLREQGITVTGVDPTPEFLDRARTRYPDARFRAGRAEALDVAAGSLSGILAWFSLIHTPPHEVPAILDEFARCVEPGGGLLLGFFEGPELVPFDHKIVTAYFWPIDELSRVVEKAGFTVTSRDARVDPGSRRQGAITAIRT